MNRHHLHFTLKQFIQHKNRSNQRLHLVTGCFAWLALTTALSQVTLPVPFEVPVLGANLGTAFVAASVLYWMAVDLVVSLSVLLLTVGWAAAPFTVWGPGHGWLFGVALPAVVILVTEAVNRYSHVFHHENGAFLKGDPPLRAAIDDAHAVVWGAFHFGLISLLESGYRRGLRAQLDDQERRTLKSRERVPWSNWAKLASARAQYVAMPQTVEDLVDAVEEAHRRGQRVRVVASGFSWSSLVPSEDTLIFCERLNRIQVDVSEPEKPFAWVEVGVTNRQLNAELERHGLCMPWNVVLENVRLGGIVSTGTHGTGKATSTVGDLVEAFEIVDARGKLRVLSEETVGKETMAAARMGLGLFGVIARVKLRVIPSYRVRQTDARVSVEEMLRRLPELIGKHDSVELYWFPFNRDMWMRTIDRTEAPRTFQGHGFWFKTANFLQNAWIILSSKVVMKVAPGLTPALLRLSMRFLPFSTRIVDLPESHHYHYWIEMMPAGCMEVGFKADPDLGNVRAVWSATEKLVDAYAKRGLYPLNLSLNVRFIGESGALLTPAYGEGMTCYVEIMWMGRPQGWSEFSSELCREWLKIPGALPHWSKEFEHVQDVVPIMRKNLGDRRERFLKALDESGIDPKRDFFNAVLERVLIDDPSSPSDSPASQP